MNYKGYRNKGEYKRALKKSGPMLGVKEGRKKVRTTANYGKFKNIPLTDREAMGGGVFDNYRTKR